MPARAVLVFALAGCGRISFDLEGGLVARFTMDEDPAGGVLSDHAGTNHGTCALGACPVLATGMVGSAYQFDGTNDMFIIPDSPALHLTSGFTLAMWARCGSGTLISKLQAAGVGASFEVYVNSMTRQVAFCTDADPGPDGERCFDGEAVDTAWNHVAATWDGADRRIYINGTLTNTQAGTTIYDTSPMTIGADYEDGSTNSASSCTIDELYVYDHALNAPEIVELRDLR